jgi:hypothetical protein
MKRLYGVDIMVNPNDCPKTIRGSHRVANGFQERTPRRAVAPSSPSPPRLWLEGIVLFVGVRIVVDNGSPPTGGGSHILELKQ